MAETELYVVTDGMPGPNAVSGPLRRELIGKMRQQAVAVEQGAAVDATTVELLRGAASQLEMVGAQFVELETEDGRGVGPASGIVWEGYPGKYSEEEQVHTLYRFGPFMAPRSLSASEALVRAAKAVDAMFSGGSRRWQFGTEEVDGEAADVLLILHDCLNDLEREAETELPVKAGHRTRLEEATMAIALELRGIHETLRDGLGQR